MLSVKGKNRKGIVKLMQKVEVKESTDVIVTFLEDTPVEENTKFDLNELSAAKSRKLLKDYKCSLNDTIIAERQVKF